jgi:DNA-binding winged helix-turn-helix (wHTH) protein
MIGNMGRLREASVTKPDRNCRLFEALLLWPNLHLQIGDFIVDVSALRITTSMETTRLTANDMTVLIELARHRGETLSHTQLLRRVWGEDRESHDISVRVAITKLRRVLCDPPKAPRYIQTIPCMGYRLIAPVTFLQTESEALRPSLAFGTHATAVPARSIGPS